MDFRHSPPASWQQVLELTHAAGLGSYVSSLFHITGMLASLIAGVVADRFGRTPVIFAMAHAEHHVLHRIWLADRGAGLGRGRRWGWSTARGPGGLAVVVPFAVGAYITAAYWFTASTSFANPAVTFARSLTNTFAGIRPVDASRPFMVAQLAGAAAATALFRWLR